MNIEESGLRKRFLENEAGAVTVDWVVLTAGLVGLGIATMAVVSAGVQNNSSQTSAQISGQIITTGFAPSMSDALNLYDEPLYNNEGTWTTLIGVYASQPEEWRKGYADQLLGQLEEELRSGNQVGDGDVNSQLDQMAMVLHAMENNNETYDNSRGALIVMNELGAFD